jgi:hypothetical protein
MTATRHGLCVLALVFLGIAGCKTFDLNLQWFQTGPTPGGDRVLAGSLESVAASTEGTLSRLGLFASSTRKGDAIYISSSTITGAKFTLVLTREKSQEGERTRVHVDWENGRDEQVAFQLLSQLEASHK